MNRLTPLLLVATGAAALGIFGPIFAPAGSGLFTVPLPVDLGGVPGVPAGIGGAAGPVSFGPLYIDGAGTSPETVVGNGGWVVLFAGYGSRAIAPSIALERKIDSADWERVGATIERSSDGALQVRTPEWSTFAGASEVQYRLASGEADSPDVTSSAVTVRYENQRYYSGLAATIYADVAEYCPSAAVRIGDLPEQEAGRFTTGSHLIEIDPAVGVTRALGAVDIRAVALHECSHQRQWMNYGGTSSGRAAMEAAAAGIFSESRRPDGLVTPYEYEEPTDDNTPVEHGADCGAQALNPGGYLGYGGWCSPAQLDAGRRLLLGRTY